MFRFSLRQSLVLWGMISLTIAIAIFSGRFVQAEEQLLLGASDGVYLEQANQRYYFFHESAFPLWSPDGQLVALQGDNNFYLSNAASRLHYELNLEANERFVYRPVWPDNSQKIAVLMEEASEGHFQLLIIDCFTKEVSDYDFPSGETVLLWWEGTEEIRFVTVEGRQVQLWRYNLAGTTPEPLQTWRFTNYMVRDAVLNPDRQGFILPAITTTLQNFELYDFDLEGSFSNISNRATHNDTNPVWSPDGTRLVYRALGDSVQFILMQETGQLETVLGRFDNVVIRDMQWIDNQQLSVIVSHSGMSSICTLDVLSLESRCSEPSVSLSSMSWRPR